MSKIAYFIIQLVILLFIVYSFSNGFVHFIKNINKEENSYLVFLLTLLITNLFIIIEQYKLLKEIYKDEK